ncbi:hypothetical protein [Thiolapillus sp.]|uniref:hypothetical protein n=1 Tax=Thiolapillus sp. TaxID=2017437 RepID=UPI003AF62299
MFAIVPRETFGCWFFAAMPFCRSAGRSAGRSVLLLVYVCLMVFCLSAGLSAALLACCVCFGLPGDSRLTSLCLPVLWCFSAVGHIAALLICAASTFHACLSFQLPNFQCL